MLSPSQFKSIFKLTPQLTNVVWNLIIQTNGNVIKAKHLLWTLHFLKSADPDHNRIATLLNTNYRTMMAHVQVVLTYLNNTLPDVFSFSLIIFECAFLSS